MMGGTHSVDRGLRLIAGLVLVSLPLTNATLAPVSINVAVIIGIYSLLTGAFNICPLAILILKEKKLHIRKHNALHEIRSLEASELEFFRELSNEEIEQVLSCCQLREYPRDTAVIAEGAQRKNLSIIVSGSFKVVKSVVGSETKTITTLAEGEAFGEMSFFDHMPAYASVISLDDCRVLELDDARYFELVRENPLLENKILHRLLRTADSRIRLLNEQISTLGQWVVQGRNNAIKSEEITQDLNKIDFECRKQREMPC
jgi:CRP-like cAMP-binding protein